MMDHGLPGFVRYVAMNFFVKSMKIISRYVRQSIYADIYLYIHTAAVVTSDLIIHIVFDVSSYRMIST